MLSNYSISLVSNISNKKVNPRTYITHFENLRVSCVQLILAGPIVQCTLAKINHGHSHGAVGLRK